MLMARAEQLANKGEFLEAIVCFDELIELHPDNQYAWEGKGRALTGLGKREEARVCLERAATIVREINGKKEPSKDPKKRFPFWKK